jgi:hypothetical protein
MDCNENKTKTVSCNKDEDNPSQGEDTQGSGDQRRIEESEDLIKKLHQQNQFED